jgi:hypothetical protein
MMSTSIKWPDTFSDCDARPDSWPFLRNILDLGSVPPEMTGVLNFLARKASQLYYWCKSINQITLSQ